MRKIRSLIKNLQLNGLQLKTVAIVKNTVLTRQLLNLFWKHKLIFGYALFQQFNFLFVFLVKSRVLKNQIPELQLRYKRAVNHRQLRKISMKVLYCFILYSCSEGFSFLSSIRKRIGGYILW